MDLCIGKNPECSSLSSLEKAKNLTVMVLRFPGKHIIFMLMWCKDRIPWYNAGRAMLHASWVGTMGSSAPNKKKLNIQYRI